MDEPESHVPTIVYTEPLSDPYVHFTAALRYSKSVLYCRDGVEACIPINEKYLQWLFSFLGHGEYKAMHSDENLK
jgi:hypothetical protein